MSHGTDETDSSEDSVSADDEGQSPHDHVESRRGVASLRVTGKEFVASLKDALLEMDVDAASREEIHALARFLVAFCTEDRKQTLTYAQLCQLTFTFRLESVDKTRFCLFGLLKIGPNVTDVRQVEGGFLVPTDTLVSYLCSKTYHKRTGNGRGTVEKVEFLTDSSKETSGLTGDKQFTTWRRHTTVRANFMHFLVNMFARQVPGNLMYNSGSCSSIGRENDFFACINFLQDSVLRNPMNLEVVYEKIWDNFRRLNRDPNGLVRVNELRLHCQPIIGCNWGISVQRYRAVEGEFIDKNSFIRVCHNCIL